MRTYQLLAESRIADSQNVTVGFSTRGRSFRVGVTQREAALLLLDTLVEGPVDASQVMSKLRSQGLAAIAYVQSLLGALSAGGWLRQECSQSNELLLALEPIAPRPGPLVPSTARGQAHVAPVRLQQSVMFSVEDDGRLIMQSGAVPYKAEIFSPRAWNLIYQLGRGASVEELKDLTEGLRERTIVELLEMLLEAGFLTTEFGRAPQLWSPWEMLFHARSRVGRSVGGYGGTYHLMGIVEPLPGIPPYRGGELIELPVPELRGSLSLLEASESRRSVRQQNVNLPITRDQLSELLYRTQRTRAIRHNGDKGDVLSRPYPSGGSLYELEVYPLVTLCEGLEAGIYHYRSESHELEKISELDDRSRKLAGLMGHTTLMGGMPQVVLLITARFPRVMWKYESVSYAVILKNVGVLMHALSLHATDLGLASCPAGGGDSDVMADILGADYFTESTVGELVLGSMPLSDEVVDVRE